MFLHLFLYFFLSLQLLRQYQQQGAIWTRSSSAVGRHIWFASQLYSSAVVFPSVKTNVTRRSAVSAPVVCQAIPWPDLGENAWKMLQLHSGNVVECANCYNAVMFQVIALRLRGKVTQEQWCLARLTASWQSSLVFFFVCCCERHPYSN